MDQGVQPAPRIDSAMTRPDVTAPQRLAPQSRRRGAVRDSSLSMARARPRESSIASGATTNRPQTELRSLSGSATNGAFSEAKAKERLPTQATTALSSLCFCPRSTPRRSETASQATQLRWTRLVNARSPRRMRAVRRSGACSHGCLKASVGSSRSFGSVIGKARVFQGGGNELTTSSLREGVETAGRHALTRQFPKFATGR